MGTTYYFLPTRNLFGEDSVKETGSLMQSLGGKKTLIVTDAFLAKQGMARMVQDILKDSGVESVVFGGVEPNPKDVNVEAGLKVFKENGCDSIISLGTSLFCLDAACKVAEMVSCHRDIYCQCLTDGLAVVHGLYHSQMFLIFINDGSDLI